jgi:hypothetical protein
MEPFEVPSCKGVVLFPHSGVSRFSNIPLAARGNLRPKLSVRTRAVKDGLPPD